MPDILTSAAVLAGVKNAVDILKALVPLAQSTGKGELFTKIGELQSILLDIQIRQSELLEQNRKQAEELRELQDKLVASATVEYLYNAYWQRQPDESLDGPFSPLAYDRTRQLVRMRYAGYVEADEYDPECESYSDDTEKGISIYVPIHFLMGNKVKHAIARLVSMGKVKV